MSRSPVAPDVSRCTRASTPTLRTHRRRGARYPAPNGARSARKVSRWRDGSCRDHSHRTRPRPGASRGSARSKRRRCSRSARPTQQCSTPTVGAPAVAKGPRAAVSPALPAPGPAPSTRRARGRGERVSVLRGRLHRRARTRAGSSSRRRPFLTSPTGTGRQRGIGPRGQGSIPARLLRPAGPRQARRRSSSASDAGGFAVEQRGQTKKTAPLASNMHGPRATFTRAVTARVRAEGRSDPPLDKPGIQGARRHNSGSPAPSPQSGKATLRTPPTRRVDVATAGWPDDDRPVVHRCLFSSRQITMFATTAARTITATWHPSKVLVEAHYGPSSSRSLCFMTLPVALRGSSSTNQSWRGRL